MDSFFFTTFLCNTLLYNKICSIDYPMSYSNVKVSIREFETLHFLFELRKFQAYSNIFYNQVISKGSNVLELTMLIIM